MTKSYCGARGANQPCPSFRDKKSPRGRLAPRGLKKIRRYLLSHLWHYHRLAVLNFCVRDGNRCGHYDMFTGKKAPSLSTRRPSLVGY